MRLLPRRGCAVFPLLVLLLVLTALPCLAQTAKDLTGECGFSASTERFLYRLTDGAVENRPFQAQTGQENWIEILAPRGRPVRYLSLVWQDGGAPVTLETWSEEEGAYTTFGLIGRSGFLHELVTLPSPASRLRLISTDTAGTLPLHEIALYGEGELPEHVQNWQKPCTDADILVLVAHPDDELLFFGGTIPWYTRQVGAHVAVAYMTLQNETRYHELLNGLWTAGVREYPYILNYADKLCFYMSGIYYHWGGEENAMDGLVKLLDTVRPSVVVTQDINGEYGHAAHQAMGKLMLKIIRDGARPLKSPPRKLYIHLYEENPVHMDWTRPITRDGSRVHRTSLQYAADAFQCHVSQLRGWQKIQSGPYAGQRYNFEVVEGGPLDNGAFGLAFSSVGPDTQGDDFLEHVDLRHPGDTPYTPPASLPGVEEPLPEEEPLPAEESLPEGEGTENPPLPAASPEAPAASPVPSPTPRKVTIRPSR